MTTSDNWPFGTLPPNHYGALHVDLPWHHKTYSDKGRGRCATYDTMSLTDIKALPVADLATKDCALFMWAIDPMLDVAFDVIKAWGFTFKTVGFYWEKLNADGSPFTGMGYWTRANPETCLLATRGRPRRLGRDVPRLIRARRRAHSQKPEEVSARIERLVPGPYAELFARRHRVGWDVWGNETTKFEAAA